MPAVQRHRSILHVCVFLDSVMISINVGHNPWFRCVLANPLLTGLIFYELVEAVLL